jgi:ubiquinone/menaquinone biosynthesis C-methylase UbiE
MSGPSDKARDHVSTVAAAFDERAATYDASALHRELAEAVAEFAHLSDARVVLDIATGTGLVLRAIASREPSARLVGLDISRGMLMIARAALPEGQFIEAAAEQLPMADGSVDLITCVTAMHLIADPDIVFAEFARALAPQGRLVLATFEPMPTGSPVARPYRTNHSAFQSAQLVALAAAPSGLTLRRSATGSYGGEACLLTELSR